MLLPLLAVLLIIGDAEARTLCWKGGANTLCTGSNWVDVGDGGNCSSVTCASSGLPDNEGPASTDTLIFHSGCLDNATTGSGPGVACNSVSVTDFKILSGYTGAITATYITVSNDFIQQAGTVTLGTSDSADLKNITISGGTFNAPIGKMLVRGNLDLSGAGVFDPKTGEVTLPQDVSQTISGDFTFYDLVKTAGTAGLSLSFGGGSTTTVKNKLELTGVTDPDDHVNYGQPLILNSHPNPNVVWNIKFQGDLALNSLAFLVVRHSAADTVAPSQALVAYPATLDGATSGWIVPTPTPTASPTNTPTATPTQTPTSTPTDTPTPLPTSTPTATPTASPTPTRTPTPAAIPISVQLVIAETPIPSIPIIMVAGSSTPPSPLPTTDADGVITQSFPSSQTIHISSGFDAIRFAPISENAGSLAARSPVQIDAERLVVAGSPCRRFIYDSGEEVIFPFINNSDVLQSIDNADPLNILTREGGDAAATQPPSEFSPGGGAFVSPLSEFASSDPSVSRITARWKLLGMEKGFSFDPTFEPDPLPLCEGRSLLPCAAFSDAAAAQVLKTISTYGRLLKSLEKTLRKQSSRNKKYSTRKYRGRSKLKIKLILATIREKSKRCSAKRTRCKQEQVSKRQMRRIFAQSFKPNPRKGKSQLSALRRQGARDFDKTLTVVPDYIVTCR